MNAVKSSKEVLTRPAIGSHFVHVYQGAEVLAEAVSHFMCDGLASSEAALMVATDAHSQAFCAYLRHQGVDVSALIGSGQLTICNAEALMASFMLNGKPDWKLFELAVGGIFKELFKTYETARVYGEMVDILWQRNEKRSAVQLEEYWNRLLKDYSFSLLCAYYLDNLDPENYKGSMECVCKTHTHFLPAQNTHQLEEAVGVACKDVMGVDLSGLVSSISKLKHPTTIMSPAQASLLYLSKTMPLATQSILARVRVLFEQKQPVN